MFTTLEIYVASAHLPNSHALATVDWRELPGQPSILLLPHTQDLEGQWREAWTPEDLSTAGELVRWLETDLPSLIGRPKDSGDYADANEAVFFDDLGKAAHEAVRQGDRVNFITLARWGGRDRRTWSKYVGHFGYDLRAIEAEAFRCLKLRHMCSFHVQQQARFKKNGA